MPDSIMQKLDQPIQAVPEAPPPVTMRSFDDADTTRQLIFDKSLEAARKIKPVSNSRYSLHLTDVDYEDPDRATPADRKKAVLPGGTLSRRMRGTWVLKDAAGQELERKRLTLAKVPMMTSDGGSDGTFVLNGVDWSLASQMRLRPGIYSRIKSNGEIESHSNPKQGTGMSHHFTMEPETGVLKMQLSQANLGLFPILKHVFGVSDTVLRKEFGNDLFSSNSKKEDAKVVDKLYAKLVRRGDPETPYVEKASAVKAAFEKMEFDPEVNARTLGYPHKNVNVDTILAAAKKLLALNKGEVEPDDRDHLAYQTYLGPEDLISERFSRIAAVMNPLLWRVSTKGTLDSMPVNSFHKHVMSSITDSGLGQPIESTNAMEVLDHNVRASRLGVGGIASAESIPQESHNVHSSQIGLVDTVKSPESGKAGVDVRMAHAAKKGSDGRIYASYTDPKTGKAVWKSPQDVSDLKLVFPGEYEKNEPHVYAIVDGKVRAVPRDKGDLVLPQAGNWFSPSSMLVPMQSASNPQRMSMGSRFINQSLPLENAESPLVRGQVPGQPGVSFEEKYGRKAGAIHATQNGRVISVSPDKIQVRYEDGTVQDHLLHNHLPNNRKTELHNTPMVQPGDPVQKNQLLAKSNFTDDKGHVALGLNANTAYVADGHNFEDSITISEDFAKRLRSNHLYQHSVDWEDNHRKGKKNFVGIFPAKFDRKMLANVDDDGVIKPGTPVKMGDPLILAAAERPGTHKSVHASHKKSFTDQSLTWDHHDDGVVTDAVKTAKGVVVAVRTSSEMQVGDKMCVDPLTKVMTKDGFKFFPDVTLDDEIATLNQLSNCLEWQKPTDVFSYEHNGEMIEISNDVLDMLVTPDHECWVASRPQKSNNALFNPELNFKFVKAKDVVTKRSAFFSRSCNWLADDVVYTKFPAANGRPVLMDDWVRLAAHVVSHGRNHHKLGFGLTLLENCKAYVIHLLTQLGVDFEVSSVASHGNAPFVVIKSEWVREQLLEFTRVQGKTTHLRVPTFVQDLSKRQILLFLTTLCRARHSNPENKLIKVLCQALADDLQLLAIKAGMSSSVLVCADEYRGKAYQTYEVKFYNRPTATLVASRPNNVCRTIAYSGNVYCVRVPNHIMLVSRNNKAYWTGNSGRYGDKGVVGRIASADEMPRDPKTGKPFDVLMNPLGIITRQNASQMIEAWLGKIAAKTGKPYVVPDFGDIADLTGYAQAELAKHGEEGMTEIEDPQTGRRIKAATGVRYVMKLHHQAASKHHGRGLGAYTADDAPARGGEEGAKRLALQDTQALLSHGAFRVLRDAKLVRGQKNHEYWADFMSGHTPATPKAPLIYRKFLEQLRASGVNVERKGSKLHLMALTDKDVDHLASNRNIENAETVDWKNEMKGIKGGLFDETLTGGHGRDSGGKWAAIQLHEPMPSPVFEEPIRHMLGLTEKQFTEVVAGREKLNNKTGPSAIGDALARIDVKREMAGLRDVIANGRKGARDTAIRKLGYLKGCETTGVHPKEWMLSRVPVLPPIFRPVSQMQGSKTQLVADTNLLYKEVWDANKNLKDLSSKTSDVSEERLNLYKAFKGLTGLGDPIQAKNQERGVRGLLKAVFGDRPKTSVIQQKLLGMPVDLIGRAVVTPNPDLSMDEAGIPEARAWEVYAPFLVRRMVRSGMSRVASLQAVKDRTKHARDAMLAEMNERPIMINRAPVLHRYGRMAFYPRLVKGDTLQLSPLINKPFGLDHDGNCIDFNTEIVLTLDQSLLPSSCVDFNKQLEGLVMCSTKQTLVELCREGKGSFKLKIGEFPTAGLPSVENGSQTIYSLPDGISIPTYDYEAGKTCFNKVSSFTVDRNHTCVRVTTKRGRELNVSDNESLCVFDVKTGELRKEAPAKAVGLLMPYIKNDVIIGTKYDRDIGWWYGAMVADGWVCDRMVGYSKNSADKRAEFVRIAKTICPDFTVREYSDSKDDNVNKFGSSVKVHLNGKGLAEKILPVGDGDYLQAPADDRKALYKKIPDDLLLNGSRECLLGLLTGLFQGDKSIGWNKAMKKPRFYARLNTSSPYLVESAQLLMRKLGIRSGVTISPARNNSKQAYVVSPCVTDIQKVFAECKFVGVEDGEVIAEFLATPCGRPYGETIDVVPLTTSLSDAFASVLLASGQKTLYTTCRQSRNRGYFGRYSAKKILALIPPEFDHQHFKSFRKQAENDDVHWDAVDTVEQIETQDVYDFEVLPTKLFAVANGLVVYDTSNYDIPADDEAAREAIDKMLPSRNLISAASLSRPLYQPANEFVSGLYSSTNGHKQHTKPRVFATTQDALKAYNNGELDPDDPVTIVNT